MLALGPLFDRVVLRHLERDLIRVHADRRDALASVEPGDVGNEGLHHERTGWPEVPGDRPHARDLVVLREEPEERVEDHVDELEALAEVEVAEVSERDGDPVAAGFRAELLHHRRRRVDRMDLQTGRRERQRHAAGPDAELERGPCRRAFGGTRRSPRRDRRRGPRRTASRRRRRCGRRRWMSRTRPCPS